MRDVPGPRVGSVVARELLDKETALVHRTFAKVTAYSDGLPMQAWDIHTACGLRDGTRFDVIEAGARVTCLDCLANEETARAQRTP